jgi:NitT/TauT family transport system substrate-binding protein
MWSSKERPTENRGPRRVSKLSRKVATAFASLACLGWAMAAASPADAACQKTDPLRVMIFAGSYPTMLTFIGKDAGFYEKNCLDVTLVPINSGPAGIAQLETNGIQISDSTVDNVVIARSRGLKVKIVSDQSAANSYSLVASNKFATPHEKEGWPGVMKDFIGKRIGVYALGAGSHYMVRALFREAGLDPDKAAYVAVGAPPTQLAALKNGAVDAVIMIAPGQDIAEAQHYGRVVVDLRKKGVGPKDIQALGKTFQVKVAADKFIDANPDIMKRYLKANEEAEAWIHDPANFQQLLKYMAKNVKIGSDVPNGEKLFSSLIKFWASVAVTGVNREAIDAWSQFEVNSGNIPKPVSYGDVVWSGAPIMK